MRRNLIKIRLCAIFIWFNRFYSFFFSNFKVYNFDWLIRKQETAVYRVCELVHNSFCALIAHVRYFKILTWLRGFRVKVANFHDSIVSQFPEETRAQRKPNLTKYRKMTRKPRSYVRILIYRTWAMRNGPGYACVGRLHRSLWALSICQTKPSW